MSRLRQLTRSIRENGASLSTFWRENTSMSRIRREIWYSFSFLMKKRSRRSLGTSRAMFAALLAVLDQRHRERVRLLSGGTRGDPHAHGLASGGVFEDPWKYGALENVEGLGVEEQARDRDEHVLVQ